MKIPQNILELEQLIVNGVEENTTLEYKSAEALQNTDSKKKEIAKDVSAMANSVGGIIIYGIKEFDSRDKNFLPEKITPINRCQFSRDQLEQIINSNISPKIEGLLIHPIPLTKVDEVVYVVEIPQSNTAHQNTRDHLYYKRNNFQVVPMLDYEIRDVMNRGKHPVLKLAFIIEKHTYELKNNPLFHVPTMFGNQSKPPEKKYQTDYTLKIIPVNRGKVFAQYVNYFVLLPDNILEDEEVKYLEKKELGLVEFYGENTHRDVLEAIPLPLGGYSKKYGPSRFDPILPGLYGRSEKLKIADNAELNERKITWTIYADSAPPMTGSVKLNEIEIIERGVDSE